MSFISGLSIFCIAETKDKALEDLIGSGHVVETIADHEVIFADHEADTETSKWITVSTKFAHKTSYQQLLARYWSIQTEFVDI